MKQSNSISLNQRDYLMVAKNALIFAGPAILVLLASFKDIIPQDSSYAIFILYALNIVTDLIKKFLAGK